MSDPRMMLNALANQLAGYAYRYSNETRLHEAMANVLELHGFAYEREVALDARNRVDFIVDGIVIEVKVGGSMSDALHQVGRYINLPQVKGVILASTTRWADTEMEAKPAWLDKPFRMIKLQRQSL